MNNKDKRKCCNCAYKPQNVKEEEFLCSYKDEYVDNNCFCNSWAKKEEK